jgi:hypothetical protein
MLPTQIQIIWPSGFRDFLEIDQSETSHLWRPCLSMDRDEMSTLYRGPPIDVSVHLTKRFQRRRILKISQSETSRLWWPCLLTDRDEMSNFYRGPSIDVSYQVSVHLAKRFQRRRF